MGENLARKAIGAHLSEVGGDFYEESRIGECELVDSYMCEQTRWSIFWLHTYRHRNGDVIGVFNECGATEMQYGDYRPELVDVEVDPRPRYLVQR